MSGTDQAVVQEFRSKGKANSPGAPTHLQSRLLLLVATALATAISIQIQGFSIGLSNNFYQIPILEHWAANPSFASDPFVASLRYYVSGVWGLLGLLPRVLDTKSLLFILRFLGRWATLLSFCAVAGSLGLRRLSGQCALAFWWALAASLHGLTKVGVGELFVDYFTQTEIAVPLILLAIWLAARGRVFWAFAVTGLVFDTNIFYAVWTGCALGSAVMFQYFRNGDRKLLIHSAQGLALAAGLALPVAYWTLNALTRQPAYRAFDYVQFLRVYYPNHFLIAAASPSEALLLLVIFATSVMAFWTFGEPARVWMFAFGGFGLVFLGGTVLPQLSHSALLLNLHLLRVDGLLILFAVVLLSILAAHNLTGTRDQRLAGVCALLLLGLPNPAGIAFAAVVLAVSSSREWSVS